MGWRIPTGREANQLAIYNREQIQLAVRVEIRHFLRCSRAATVKKCTKKHDARAKLLFCLLNLQLYCTAFFSILVDVAVVVA